MKSLILYGSAVKLTNAHKLVTQDGHAPYYVRAEVFEGDDLRALDSARPAAEETVLNTVEIG